MSGWANQLYSQPFRKVGARSSVYKRVRHIRVKGHGQGHMADKTAAPGFKPRSL